MTDYYSRRWEKGRFANKSDREAEDLAQRSIEAAWGCRLHKYAGFDVADFWAEAWDQTAAFIEVKSRSVESTKYPTVFLNLRKWSKLLDMAVCTGVPAYFFIVYQDSIKYINVELVDARNHGIGGTRHRVKSENDIEPVIHVPIKEMETLEKCLAA
jgi:hypothetical protein